VWLSLSSSQALPELIKEHARSIRPRRRTWYVVIVAAIYLAVLLGTRCVKARHMAISDSVAAMRSTESAMRRCSPSVVACVLSEMLAHCRGC